MRPSYAVSPPLLGLLAILSAHCGVSATPAADVGTPATDAGAPPDARDGGADGDGSMCFVDSPCFEGERFRCQGIGRDQYTAVVSHDCHRFCGPGPCSGGTCDPSGPLLSCPAGTVCVPYEYREPQTASSPCVAPGDGDAGRGDAGTDADV